MAPPTYFFPKISKHQLVRDHKLAGEILRPLRLDRTFADIQIVEADCYVEETVTKGPGDQPGTFLMAMPVKHAPPTRTGYYPDHQDWTEFHEGDQSFWACLDKHQPPTPAELARKGAQQFDGYWTELGALNQKWLVPVIRDLSGGSGLPKDWILGSDGQVREEIQTAYRELWTEFAGVVDLFLSPDDAEGRNLLSLDPAEALKWCIQALSLNYRVGRVEQNLLRLIGSENWFRVLAAAVDLWTFWDVYHAATAKKNASPAQAPKPELQSIAPGEPADSPITDPAAVPLNSSASATDP